MLYVYRQSNSIVVLTGDCQTDVAEDTGTEGSGRRPLVGNTDEVDAVLGTCVGNPSVGGAWVGVLREGGWDKELVLEEKCMEAFS